MIRIRGALHEQLLREFRYTGRETGGVLGLHGGEIRCVYTDTAAHTASDLYLPSPLQLSEAIRRFHREEDCDGICFIHSHPRGFQRLSYADRRFAQAFLELNPRYSRVGMALCVEEELFFYFLDSTRPDPVLREVEIF